MSLMTCQFQLQNVNFHADSESSAKVFITLFETGFKQETLGGHLLNRLTGGGVQHF